MFKVTRRDFLASIPLAVAAASACRRAPYRAEDFHVPVRSAVGLFPVADYAADFADVIYRGLQIVGPSVKGLRVFLKPNVVEYEAGTVINTNALVVAGAAAAFLKAGAREVIVGEGPGHRRDIEYLLVSTGLYDHLKEMRIRFVDLNHDDVRSVPLRSHFTGLSELALPVELLQSDVIVSMPKLKTHHWAGMTASMKNFFGVLPGAVYGWPKNILHVKGIANSILDLNATVAPHFTIVDAVVAMEGDGPIMGTPRSHGVHRDGSGPRRRGRDVRAHHRPQSREGAVSGGWRRLSGQPARESDRAAWRGAEPLRDHVRPQRRVQSADAEALIRGSNSAVQTLLDRSAA